MRTATPAPGGWQRGQKRKRRGWWPRGRYRWTLLSLVSFWLGLITLAVPLGVHADSNNLAEYNVKASGWALQPFIENDFYQNAPATDQATPYVSVSMDATPGSKAKAAYFFPGTAGNAVLIQEGQSAAIPDGVEADYPGNGSVSQQLQSFSDPTNFSQGAAGIQSASASEGYAKAEAALANYQFMPTTTTPPVATPPSVPTVGLPTPSPSPTPSPASTPKSGQPSPTPTPTQTCVVICLGSAKSMGTSGGQASSAQATPTPPQLPDVVEQQLVAALRAAELAQPQLVTLAGGHTAATSATLPYAGADLTSSAETRATDDGVTIAMDTHAANVQLLQGLITFANVETTVQAVAPAAPQVQGYGTLATHVTDAQIAGIPVTIDAAGVHVIAPGATPAQITSLSAALDGALQAAGVEVVTAENETTQDVGYWAGRGGGVDVIASLTPANAASQAGVVTATHVEFSIARLDAHIYALGASPTASGGDFGGGGGFCFFCFGGGDNGGGSSGPSSTPPAPQQPTSQLLSIPAGMTGWQILALAFIIQGVSTAAVAGAAGFADSAAKASKPVVEEESK